MSDFIDITLEESLVERWLSVGWDHLMPGEQELLALDWVVSRISNAGMHSAYDELRSEWPKAVAGLRRIGATGVSAVLAEAADKLGYLNEERLRRLEDEFWSRYESERVSETIGEYGRSHDNEFPGPRSLLEIWNSMQARGVAEKPRRLLEMERRAATDAPLTDR